ncbi:MAG: hypothetical protein R3F11_20730 [Verrucomicrobiales bacterium]
MKLPALLKIVALLLVTLVCAYGALASLEPTATSPVHTGWLIGYSMIGFVSLGFAVQRLRKVIARSAR